MITLIPKRRILANTLRYDDCKNIDLSTPMELQRREDVPQSCHLKAPAETMIL